MFTTDLKYLSASVKVRYRHEQKSEQTLSLGEYLFPIRCVERKPYGKYNVTIVPTKSVMSLSKYNFFICEMLKGLCCFSITIRNVCISIQQSWWQIKMLSMFTTIEMIYVFNLSTTMLKYSQLLLKRIWRDTNIKKYIILKTFIPEEFSIRSNAILNRTRLW